MFNKWGDSVARLAEKTKSFAVEALEAIDAPEPSSTPPVLVPPPTESGGGSRRGSSSSGVVDENEKSLFRLIEGITGSCDPGNMREEVSVILTQLDLIREHAFTSKALSETQKELASCRSIIAFLDSVLEADQGASPHRGDAAESLLEALETEQRENEKIRQKLNSEIFNLKKQISEKSEMNIQRIKELEIENMQFRGDVEAAHAALRASELEQQKLNLVVQKLVSEKSALELEKDDSDKIDGRIFRSAFISLCTHIDNNKSVRNGVLMVMSEMLKLSPEEKARCGVTGGTTMSEDRLAKKFLDFLQDEIGPDSPDGK